MFDLQWFKIHQKTLLFFANSWWGRKILCLDGTKSSIGENRIIAVLPHAILWREKKFLKAEFRTHPKFAKRIYFAFQPLWNLFHLWDTLIANNFFPNFNLGFDSTGNLFPAAGTVSPVDGSAARTTVNETFGTIRAGAGNTSQDTLGGATFCELQASTTTDQFQSLTRSIICFNTSVIGPGATITAATYSLNGDAKSSALGSPDIDVVSATPADTGDIVNADFTQLGSTPFASITFAAYNTGGYNDFTLDSNGLNNISPTGVSKFGNRTSWDTDNSFTGTWASNAQSTLNGEYADAGGTGTDPKLVVTYLPGVGGYAFVI